LLSAVYGWSLCIGIEEGKEGINYREGGALRACIRGNFSFLGVSERWGEEGKKGKGVAYTHLRLNLTSVFLLLTHVWSRVFIHSINAFDALN